MTKNETSQVIELLTSVYPRTDGYNDPNKVMKIIDVWHDLLGDLDFGLIKMAVQKHILSSQFPPTIHDIRQAALDMMRGEQPTAADGWNEVMKAVTKYGNYQAEKAMESFSPITKKVVEAMTFRSICMAEEEMIGVTRGQFLKMYEQINGRVEKYAMLPEQIRLQIEGIGKMDKTLKIESGEEEKA